MVDSPIKKMDFKPVDKENLKGDAPIVTNLELKRAHVEIVEKGQRPVVALGIKDHEADEPLLQENPHRFVLFPIKYHEVGVANASRVKYFKMLS
jgi:ribonucleoside-diphosphate reductase subunit M2